MSDSSLTSGKSLETDLRLIREARGLSREDIFNRVHIRPEVLAQVEENGFGATPTLNSDIHRRSFVKHYADAVDIDAEIAIAALEKSMKGEYDGSLAVAYLGETPLSPLPKSDPPVVADEPASKDDTPAKAGSGDADFDLVPDEPIPSESQPKSSNILTFHPSETGKEDDSPLSDELDEAEHDLAAELKSLFESDLLAAAGPKNLPEDSGSTGAKKETEAVEEPEASSKPAEKSPSASKKADAPERKSPIRLVPPKSSDDPGGDSSPTETQPSEKPPKEDKPGEARGLDKATSAQPKVEAKNEAPKETAPKHEEPKQQLPKKEEPKEHEKVQSPTEDAKAEKSETAPEAEIPARSEPEAEEKTAEEKKEAPGEVVSPYAPPMLGRTTAGSPQPPVQRTPTSEEAGGDKPKEVPPRPTAPIKPPARPEPTERRGEPRRIGSSDTGALGRSGRKSASATIPSSTMKQSVIGPPDESDFGDEESILTRLRGRHWITWLGLIGVALAILIFAGRAILTSETTRPVSLRGIRNATQLPTQFSGIVRLSPTTERFVTLQINPDSTSSSDFLYKIWTHSAGSTFAETGEGSLNAEGNQILFGEPYGVGGLFVESGEVRLRSVRRVRFPRWEFTGRKE